MRKLENFGIWYQKIDLLAHQIKFHTFPICIPGVYVHGKVLFIQSRKDKALRLIPETIGGDEMSLAAPLNFVAKNIGEWCKK